MHEAHSYTGRVPPSVLVIVTWLVAAPAIAGIFFCALSLWGAREFRRSGRGAAGFPREHPTPPPISILKAVKGLDPDLREALRSQCLQDYPAPFELLLAVQTLEDPAVPTLRSLAAEFPRLRIEVVETPLLLGTNGKMSNLVQLLPHARYDSILITDADIAVGPRYLRRITAPFTHTETGLVTVGYRGRAHPPGRPTLGSRLEALAIATDFFPGVLTARLLDQFSGRGMRFALGSTLLVTREALARAGGLHPLLDVLADDHDLGRHVFEAGYRVVLSPEVVSTSVPAYRFREFWAHQLRWARTVRAVRPRDYFGLAFTHPVPWALLALAASSGSFFAISLLLLAVAARLAVAGLVGYGLLRDRQVLRDLAWLPLRDCLQLALWVWSYAGDTVEWRGERFRVAGGKLVRL